MAMENQEKEKQRAINGIFQPLDTRHEANSLQAAKETPQKQCNLKPLESLQKTLMLT